MKGKKWMLFSIITVILYGLTGLVAKIASEDVPPLLVQVLSSFGMIPIVIVLSFSGKLKLVPGRIRLGLFFAILVGIATAISAVAQYTAFSIGGPASVVVPVVSLASLVTILLARYVFKDRLSTFQGIGILFSLIAIVLFNLEVNGGASHAAAPWWKMVLSTWMLFALLAMFAAGTAQFLIKAATNHISADLTTLIVVTVFIVSAVALVFIHPFTWDISTGDALACISVGILGSAAFFTLSVAFSNGSASVVAPFCSLFPVVTVILATPILGERMTLLIIIAVVIATAGGFFLSMEISPKECDGEKDQSC